MQISCSAVNAPAGRSDGEQEKLEEPTSTRMADKVPPAPCPLSLFIFLSLFYSFLVPFGPPALFLITTFIGNGAFLLIIKSCLSAKA
jgi:hypothetical protein